MGSATYRCEKNRYYFSAFAVPLEIARHMHSDLQRELKINLKTDFEYLLKTKNTTPRGTQTHNLLTRTPTR